MMRLADAARLQHKARRSEALGDRLTQQQCVVEHRIAAVEGDRDLLLVRKEKAEVDRQAAGNSVAARDAQVHAVIALSGRLHQQAYRFAADTQLREHSHQHLRRVLALLRGGSVRRNAGHDDLRVAVDELGFNRTVLILHMEGVGSRLAPVACDDSRRRTRNDVRARTAGDGKQARVGHRRVELEGGDALLGVDQREVGVRRKAHVRQTDLLLVVVQILHAALLVAAEDQAALAAQRNARVHNRLHGEHRRYARALIVAGAAANETTVDDLAAVGIIVPAVTLGHHVKVGQHGDGLLALADLRIAAVAVEVARVHATARQVLKRHVKRLAYGIAKRRVVRAALRTHARHADPALQGFDHVAAQRFKGCVKLCVVLHNGLLSF